MSIWSDAAAPANDAILRTLGEEITYQTAGGVGDPLTLSVVWNDNEALLPPKVRATAWFLEADLAGASLKKNDIVQRGDFRYRIVDPPEGIDALRDGTGGITIFLRLMSHAADA